MRAGTAPERNETAAVGTEELLERWSAAKPIVRNVLAKAGLVEDTEDVMQELWESLAKSIRNFDPELGQLGAWVGRIAHHRAVDHIDAAVRKSKLDDRIENYVETDFAVTVPDSADAIVDRAHVSELLKTILDTTEEAMDNSSSFERTMALIVKYDEEVRRASSAMGISEEALRASRRETMRTAQVVAKALQKHHERSAVTLRTLLECLPEQVEGAESSGSWIRHMAHAAALCGGFGHVTPHSLVEVTGWEYNTCRQYLNQTRELMQIARTVMEYGAGRVTDQRENNE